MDGSPAATARRHGRGAAILWGTLLGAAYAQSGFADSAGGLAPPPPDRGPFAHTPLEGYDEARRRLLTGSTEALPRTWAEASHPLVETGLLETEHTLLVPLANLANGARTIELTVHGADRATAVHALHQGPLPFRQDGPTVRCTLDLDVTDFVVVER